MGTLFIKVIEISIAATFLMLAVFLIRFLLKKAPKWFMGVLWAIVALRLVFPFQIEAKIGFLPEVGSKVESFFYDLPDIDSTPEVTYHNYEPNMEDETTYVFESDDYVPTDEEIVVTDYLPNEEIIVSPDPGYVSDSSLWRRDLFVKLQMIWLFGMLLILAYAVFSYISIRKKTSVSIRLEGENNVFVCDEIETPFILGIIKPVIYLPSGLDDETTKNVLAHEKAHIKRFDHLRKQFGFLILAAYWFNPLVWISYALFCKDIELACDEKVISHMSLDEKKSYANSLLLCSTHKRLVLAYPLAFGEVGVGTRVKQIFNYRKPTLWLLLILVVICAALSSSFFTSASKENDANVNIVMTRDRFIEKWCEDFKERNAQGIIDASTDEVQQTLREEGLLDGKGKKATFGWSSPWPVMSPDTKSSCAYIYTDDDKTQAEIVYCATDSEPHVYLWKELITIAKDDNDDYKVISEEFIQYENIENEEDYEDAWNAGTMVCNALDYTQNGLGEILNENAKNSTGDEYEKLFDPLTAVRYLLNLSEDEAKVTIFHAETPEYEPYAIINFSDADHDISVGLMKPWGEDGIYVPVRFLQPVEELISSSIYEEEFGIENDQEEDGIMNLPYQEGSDKEVINLPHKDGDEEIRDVR